MGELSAEHKHECDMALALLKEERLSQIVLKARIAALDKVRTDENGTTESARKEMATYLVTGIETEIPEHLRLRASHILFERLLSEEVITVLSQGIAWAEMAGLIGDVSWAWQPWLPKGFVTIVAAEVGIGKSVLCLRIAASFLRGDPWPDGITCEGQGAVLWCETEAAQALNLARAKAWGLPIERIYSPKIADNPITDVELDLTEHQDEVTAMANWPDVKLVIVDSLRGAHRGDENSSSIEVVKWLAQLARDTDKPVLLTHHLRKRGLFDLDGQISLDRVRGSSAIIQTSRVVWAIDKPDVGIEARRLSVIKSNLTRFPEPVGLEIGDAGIEFGEAPEKPHEDTPSERAVDLLRALLDDGPMKQPDIQHEADGAGISIATLKRVKKKLGIVAKRKPDGWYWALPARNT